MKCGSSMAILKALEDGISAVKLVELPKERLMLFIQWENSAKMYQVIFLLLYLLGLMVKNLSWQAVLH